MSWSIDKNTMAVTMHKGDTGAYLVKLTRKSGEAWEDGDVAIYEAFQGSDVKIHREFNLQPEVPNEIEKGDGEFLIAFTNSDTDTWAAGTYNTEIRTVIRPIRNNKVDLYVDSDEITAEIDEDTCLAYVTTVTGTVTMTYSSDWDEDPNDYGVTVTGTPEEGDTITVSWTKEADGRVVNGDNVRTVIKSTITINDVKIDI